MTETEARAFCCELHDGPGECTDDCVALVAQMSPGLTMDYDPTGTSYGPPRPYDTYEYDASARASIRVTHIPEGQAVAWAVSRGDWVVVDGEPREVDSVSPVRYGRVWIDFASWDREPDGAPSAYLSREFRATHVFDTTESPVPGP